MAPDLIHCVRVFQGRQSVASLYLEASDGSATGWEENSTFLLLGALENLLLNMVWAARDGGVQRWRIRGASAGRWEVTELAFHAVGCGGYERGGRGETRVAAVSSGYYDDFAAARAFDGDRATTWRSGCEACDAWIGALLQLRAAVVTCVAVDQRVGPSVVALEVQEFGPTGTYWRSAMQYVAVPGGDWVFLDERFATPQHTPVASYW